MLMQNKALPESFFHGYSVKMSNDVQLIKLSHCYPWIFKTLQNKERTEQIIKDIKCFGRNVGKTEYML